MVIQKKKITSSLSDFSPVRPSLLDPPPELQAPPDPSIELDMAADPSAELQAPPDPSVEQEQERGDMLQEVSPTPSAMNVVSTKKRLRNCYITKKKMMDAINELNLTAEYMELSDSSDEYNPPRIRKCAVLNCDEDIFLGCTRCEGFLCYDHQDTECIEHVVGLQPFSFEDVESSEDSSSAVVSENTGQKGKRKIEKREKTVRRVRSNPSSWKKNKRKRARLAGTEHTNTAGKLVAEKSVQKCECHHGRQKVFACNEFSEENREHVLLEYYASADYSRQRDFIVNHTVLVSTASTGRRKGRHVHFFLPLDHSRRRVCKQFFLTSLNISESLIWYTLDKKVADENVSFSSRDHRGRHTPYNKTSDELLEAVRRHISSFPAVESHYVRANTSRKFLGSELNIRKMYHLYLDECKSQQRKFVGEYVYRRVFCEEFNLSFHTPRKDCCGKCQRFQDADDNEKSNLKENYDEHQLRKELARAEKNSDKEKAKAKNSIWYAVTMDLQSVLSTPCGNVSALYYARKLSVYNFTIYNQATGDGYCMVWDESQGRRGSNEIGSLLYLHLKNNILPCVRHIVITSDSTVAQNRNQYITCLLLVIVQSLPNVETIEQKFLEPGHTEMEVDSIHSTIDRARKKIRISCPYEWPAVMQAARREKPYEVYEVDRDDFFELHSLPRQLGAEQSLKAIPWMNVKCVRVTKGNTNEVEIKTDYRSDYSKIVLRKQSQKTRNTKKANPVDVNISVLKQAYLKQLPISKAKKNDLMALCASSVINKRFHSFYEKLLHCDAVRDCLPEPDCTENDEQPQNTD